ncbi:hypothetical protein BJX61DRAFT_546048 [Aspergillus egyptiacus]|nr:hypothetical protein BJX61DRAFT_546048 [Aspergillus egyptiacus]
MEASSGIDSPRFSSTSTDTRVEQQAQSSAGERPRHSLYPRHPIPQLQGPFEESINEAVHGQGQEWIVDIDAQSRRRDLLEGAQYERICGRKWRQRAGERYHPFWKLAAQMSFGLHLLIKGSAKSNAQVLKILQAHVDEVDGFISRTTEDFLIIQVDLRTRIQYLSLPLENLDIFDQMLEDRTFRLAMVDYNERIELAIERFTLAIHDALKDIQKGKEAVGAVWQYLGQSARDHGPLSSSLTAIYNSMFSNTEGWNLALSKLRRKGTALQYAIKQLARAVTEMQRRVGVASRKDASSKTISRAKSFRGLFDRELSVCTNVLAVAEPLPGDPAVSKAPKAQSRPSAGRLSHQKSVPILRAPEELDNYPSNAESPDRAKSMDGPPSRGSHSGSILPRLQKTISRQLSKAKFPMKVTTEEINQELPRRPATSASRTLRSFRISRHGQQEQKQEEPLREPPLPNQTRRPATANTLIKGQTMKDQLLQYFKSDRVLDIWESIAEKDLRTGQSDIWKDGLWSRFQTKPSNAQPNPLQADILQENIKKQMTWLEDEAKNMNKYSLKPKYETAPRVHTNTDTTCFEQQMSEADTHYNGPSFMEAVEADESVITALPAFPLPPLGHRLSEPTKTAS